jgi:regulator of RNase E activity RraB
MINILNQEEIKNSNKNTIILLNLIGNMLLRSEGLDSHLKQLVSLLAHFESLFYDND